MEWISCPEMLITASQCHITSQKSVDFVYIQQKPEIMHNAMFLAVTFQKMLVFSNTTVRTHIFQVIMFLYAIGFIVIYFL
jgi:hypothetical protein